MKIRTDGRTDGRKNEPKVLFLLCKRVNTLTRGVGGGLCDLDNTNFSRLVVGFSWSWIQQRLVGARIVTYHLAKFTKYNNCCSTYVFCNEYVSSRPNTLLNYISDIFSWSFIWNECITWLIRVDFLYYEKTKVWHSTRLLCLYQTRFSICTLFPYTDNVSSYFPICMCIMYNKSIMRCKLCSIYLLLGKL